MAKDYASWVIKTVKEAEEKEEQANGRMKAFVNFAENVQSS